MCFDSKTHSMFCELLPANWQVFTNCDEILSHRLYSILPRHVGGQPFFTNKIRGRIKLLHPGDDPKKKTFPAFFKSPVSYSYPGDHTFHVMLKKSSKIPTCCKMLHNFSPPFSPFGMIHLSVGDPKTVPTVPPRCSKTFRQLVSEAATTCIERVRYRIGALVELEPNTSRAQRCA